MQTDVREALADFLSADLARPSCQAGLIERCKCLVCVRQRARAALAASPQAVDWKARAEAAEELLALRSKTDERVARLDLAASPQAEPPVAYLRSINHPDWLEVCERGEEGAFPVYATTAPAQAEPTGYVDCGECPRISTGCKGRCAKATPKRSEG